MKLRRSAASMSNVVAAKGRLLPATFLQKLVLRLGPSFRPRSAPPIGRRGSFLRTRVAAERTVRCSPSVQSNAVRVTDLEVPPFSGSSVDWAAVKQDGGTVYLCIPPSRLKTHAQFLRLMFSVALAKMETKPPLKFANGNPWRPVLFLMDEFANLGHVEKISTAYALMRGYGIKLWAFVQDLTQLKDLYSDRWETFVGNADVIQCFGTRDGFTSEYISKLSGDFTQRIVSQSSSQSQTQNAPVPDPMGKGGGHATTGSSVSQSTSESFSTIPLLYPSDVRELQDNEQILIIKGRATIQWRVRWYQDQPYLPHVQYLENRKALPMPQPALLGVPANE